MPPRDFARALRAADDEWAEQPMSPGTRRRLDERVRESLASGSKRARAERSLRVRLRYVPAFVAAAAVLLLLVGLGSRRRQEEFGEGRTAGFTLVAQSSNLAFVTDAEGFVDIQQGGCTLRDEAQGVTAEVSAPARLRRLGEHQGIHVERGTVTFAIDHRDPAELRRIVVSDGSIEITGTRFTVEQRKDGGHVQLTEGGIRFLAPGRAPIALRPGDGLSWPLPPTSTEEATSVDPGPASDHEAARPEAGGADANLARDPAPSATRKDGALARSTPDDDLLARIEALRARGRYAEAAALASGSPALASSTRERLSFERGALLTYQLADRGAACAHWKQHDLAFPHGRYAIEVARAKRQLSCP